MISDGTNSATYTYLANSPLVSQIAFKQNATTRMTTTKVYDYLNRLKSISSVSSATTNSFAYSYNYANQRSGVTNSDNSKWVYQYDDLGQVISGKKYWSDGTPVAGQQFEYAFDDIGNRTSTKAGGDQSGANLRSATYDANSLNQYDSRTVPGAVDIIGSATNTATVTVNNQATYRKSNYFRDQLSLNNSSAAVWAGITNVAVLNNGTNADIVATNLGYLYLPKTPETFTYDDDGNLKQDGRWQYVWDGENRLVSMTSLTNAPTASKLKLDFAYDYMGRRVQKMVWTNNGTSYFPLYTNRFVYDGWNLLAELNPANGIIRSYIWGTDLSGTTQGAGGVGGLLLVADTALGSSFVAFDGNGNVSKLVAAANGTESGHYEYGAFGEVLRATSALAKKNPFRYSGKYYDDETYLLYYGQRYYGSSVGSWLNVDPLGEWDGPNQRQFARNAPTIFFDADGLQIFLSTPVENFVRTGLELGEQTARGPGTPPEWLPQPAPKYTPLYAPRGIGQTPPVPIAAPQQSVSPETAPQAQTDPRYAPEPKGKDDQEGDKRPHAGEFHVQFGGLQQAKFLNMVVWRRWVPLNKRDGSAKLDLLWNGLNPTLQSELADEFKKARKFITSQPAYGVAARHLRNWPTTKSRCWHLDLEVVTGRAFVNDDYQQIKAFWYQTTQNPELYYGQK